MCTPLPLKLKLSLISFLLDCNIRYIFEILHEYFAYHRGDS